MNSRLRWRSLTRAWTLPVSRSMPASKLTVPWRLYSWSRANNAQQAVVEVGALLDQGHPEVVDADLADYFRVHAGLGRQIGCRRCDRLDPWLLVVGDDRNRVARLLLRGGCLLLQELHLAINAQHFGHLLRKLRIAAFQVVTHLVRLHLLLVEDLAHRALYQGGETRVPLRRPMLASMAGQKPGRPQFVRIAKILGLAACQRRQPCLGFHRDRRLLARVTAIVQRRHGALNRRPLNAALDRLMMPTAKNDGSFQYPSRIR